MADSLSVSSEMDINKLKVPELKKELKSRGLSTSGNKNDLVERLQEAMKNNEKASNESVDEFDEDLLNEDDDDVHLETTESVISDIDKEFNDAPIQKGHKRKMHQDEEGKAAPLVKKVVLNRNTPLMSDTRVSVDSKESESNGTSDEKKVIKLSGVSAKERLEMRAKKFSVPLGNDAKKVARAERFSITHNSDSTQSKEKADINVLKQRAQRFGGSVSKALNSVDVKEQMEKRKARFGIVTSEDKAKQRLERFKQPVK